ncbi:hypothetical protein [Mammaliicoccus sciuri]|uniref:hypothetical protein n=1 Tax=Mammaliicoccus sciuri TaxID=1296 RepID=UPI0038504368
MGNYDLNSTKLKALAEEKNQELLRLHKYGTFYKAVVRDAGYIPEYALKAVVCEYHDDVYPEHKNGYKTHKIDALLHKAKLTKEFKEEQRYNPKFKASWSTISSWTPELRYEIELTTKHAHSYIEALNDNNGGVYKWIKNFW